MLHSMDFEINQVPEETEEVKEGYIYPLSLEDWIKEFKIGNKVVIDSNTEHDLRQLEIETKRKQKELIIKNSQKYCRLNHTTEKL